MLQGLGDRAVGLRQRVRRGVRGLGQRAPERAHQEVVPRLGEREGARLAGRADDAARGAREADEVLGLPAGGAGGQVGREARCEQQLQAERERGGARGPLRLAVDQRELVGEQVVDAGVRLAVAEQAAHGVAGPRGPVDRRAVLAQPRVARDRLGAGDGHQVRLALVKHEVQPEERLEAAAEARLRPPHALGDRAHPSALGGIEVEDAVRLPVADAAQHDGLRLQGAGHTRTTLSEVMSRITVYTTEPCGYCRVAKALLAKRNVPYEEINLAKDPEGRAELVRVTGMMTFPQVVIDGEPIGGYQELVAADRSGRLSDFSEAAA